MMLRFRVAVGAGSRSTVRRHVALSTLYLTRRNRRGGGCWVGVSCLTESNRWNPTLWPGGGLNGYQWRYNRIPEERSEKEYTERKRALFSQ
ncbi:Hypothetical protein NTJ_01403 [Nesidiocoris tenuis]|uniref:Secreted protein n=1 Tax=Nesidiocoris tenuis TaxID=355587 RepID=A0ABN7A8G6_9HEMI|nr:Hypothetical protein NTJ_01403 [Nesidiocoris tenuis]